MAAYDLIIKRSAAKDVDRIEPLSLRQAIASRIAALADEPRPAGIEKLHGVDGRYRVRQGNYRIIYAIDDALRRVIVLKVRHRREAYR